MKPGVSLNLLSETGEKDSGISHSFGTTKIVERKRLQKAMNRLKES